MSPIDYDRFFGEFVGRQIAVMKGGDNAARRSLLGDDPRSRLLDAYASHSSRLIYHSARASLPPPPVRQAGDRAQFEADVADFHRRGYVVRVPDVTEMSESLRLHIRALETLVRTNVETFVFWGEAGGAAPVHFDLHDIIAIQLSGTKRWTVSTEPPHLISEPRPLAEGPPELGAHVTFDLEPGDALYMPRGTAHTAQSTGESIHLSIGFVPMTVRDAVIAFVDRIAEFDPALREGVANRADDASNGALAPQIQTKLRQALASLSQAAISDELIRQAIDHRFARSIAAMPKLSPRSTSTELTPETRLRQSPLALCQIVKGADLIDFTMPGDHLLVHPGAEEALMRIAAPGEFAVRDLGGLSADVQIALAGKFVAAGFLQTVEPDHPAS